MIALVEHVRRGLLTILRVAPIVFLMAGADMAAAAGVASDGRGRVMNQHRTEIATLAGGCFWCLEAIFQPLRGVERVVPGYSGGTVPHPTYEQVCTGTTGHAESVQVTFDPVVLSYHDLLRIFFAFHDPTTRNRQGPDEGTQYRSAIFWHDATQKTVAAQFIAELEREHVFTAPIVTELAPLTAFYPAESYHQDYYRRNPGQPYCRLVISPKMAKLRREYGDRLEAGR